ncbi:MAG: LysR family transcriptional regulator [Lachnospiraceae bacterium]|nr:LysR family transcriptional regulator [Lachnospiraceae bacterium]MDE7028709.1 LysR family transcriptional regulator [Lachnospiraceae bacterium]
MTLMQLKYAVCAARENSLNEASKKLFISQPSLSNAIGTLEKEIGIEIFNKTRTGISLTTEGEEFIGYARQVLEQYELLDAKYISRKNAKKKFSVSMQHYTFAVDAFIETIKQYGMDTYEFGVYEDTTNTVIENVRNRKSELGVLYLNSFNEKILGKLFAEYNLAFHPLFDCGLYAYMWIGHPLAGRKQIELEELMEFPCLSFAQGSHNSFYFAEEVLSTLPYKQLIKTSDRATLLNLMVGINGYTICSGIICEELNGSDYVAVKLNSDEKMTIGYIAGKDAHISKIGQTYIAALAKFREKAMM